MAMAPKNKNACVSSNCAKTLRRSTCLTSATMLLTAALVGVSFVGTASPAMANPALDKVVHGDVTLDKNGNKLTVNQQSQKAIVNWSEFSIGLMEHTHFAQPSANAIALNRVTGNNPSNILGKLTADGNVMLVNPNGVIFGKTARVDVQGLVATTADIEDQNFIDGNYNFNIKAPAGSTVNNKGLINVGDSGVAALVAPNVRNSGVIYGKASKIALAGGDSFAIDLYGDGLVNLEVQHQPRTNGDVRNSGALLAPGGTVVLTTNEAQQLVDGMVNMGSIKHAKSARIVGKKIVLDAGDNGTVEVAGDINAPGLATADSIGDLFSTQDGGSIEVKGGKITVGKKAELRADGYLGGNGGAIVVKASNTTAHVEGSLDASSSLFGGQGGTIEISGKEFLLSGTVKVGEGGAIIIDPENLYVKNGAAPGVPEANTVYEDWIESMSQGGTDVTLTASKLIQVGEIADGEITGGSGDIALLATEGGSMVGAIVFDRKTDAIATTTGSIYLEAGSGGIDIGSLRIAGGSDVPGTITVKTLRDGSVTARELQVTGTGTGLIDVDAGGDVSVDTLTVQTTASDAAASSKATVYSKRGNVTIQTATLTAATSDNDGLTSDLDATADLDIKAGADANLGSLLVQADAGVYDASSEASNLSANAQANIHTAGNLTIGNKTQVLATVSGRGNPVGAPVDANATSYLRMRAIGDLNLAETQSFAVASTNGDAYRNVTADGSADLSTKQALTANGLTSAGAIASAFDGTSTDKKTVSAKGKVDMEAETNLTVNGAVQVLTDAISDSVYSDHLASEAEGRIRSLNGDTTINAPLNVSAGALGNGAVPIEVVIAFLSASADNKNSFGYFDADTGNGQLIWSDLNSATPGDSFSITVADLEKHGFFLIPDGAERNVTGGGSTLYSSGDQVTFQKNGSGWDILLNGNPLQGRDTNAYFTLLSGVAGGRDDIAQGGMNADGMDHAYDNSNEAGNSNWEDRFNDSESDYDDASFDVTYTYGAKATANANAELLVEAANGDVFMNDRGNSSAIIDIAGSGYELAHAEALARYFGDGDVVINDDLTTYSEVDYQGITGSVEDVYSSAVTQFRAKGNFGEGNLFLNGDVSSTAITTEDSDVAHARLQANVSDDIVFNDAVNDPMAQTLTFNGADTTSVQGRTTMSHIMNNDRSHLILNAKLDPEVDDTLPGGGGDDTPPGGGDDDTLPGGDDDTPTIPGGDDDNSGGNTGNPPSTPNFANNTLNPIFIDPVERFLLSLRDAGLLTFENQRPYTVTLSSINLSLLGAALNDTANLSPEQLGSLTPAAGGMQGDSSISCANSFLDSGYGLNANAGNCGAPNNNL